MQTYKNPIYGRHTNVDAAEKGSPKLKTNSYTNNITRRNVQLTEVMRQKTMPSCLNSANIQSLRLFRHICRLIPFILRTNDLLYRVRPVQSKQYAANYFRENANLADLSKIAYLINYGYQTIYEAQMAYMSEGHLYRFLLPSTHKYRDFGVNRFRQKKADRINLNPNSKFLQSFYRGSKSHEQ